MRNDCECLMRERQALLLKISTFELFRMGFSSTHVDENEH